MKTRQGFVSNSSSSSFVVAFPKEPKSFDDVYEAMFDSKDGGISVYDMDGMSHTQVAMRVWNDIKSPVENEEYDEKRAPATKDDIAEQFSNRYHYWSSDSCVSIFGGKRDELGGQWSPNIGKYCGSDKDALMELRDFIVKTDKREREIREGQRDILDREFKGRKAPYASAHGTNRETGETCTQEEIDDYEAYCHEEGEFKKNNKKYAKLEKEMRAEIWDIKYRTEEELRKIIGEADAHEFMSDNKDAFFVILGYADDGGECVLEHGNIFRNLPCMQISNH